MLTGTDVFGLNMLPFFGMLSFKISDSINKLAVKPTGKSPIVHVEPMLGSA